MFFAAALGRTRLPGIQAETVPRFRKKLEVSASVPETEFPNRYRDLGYNRQAFLRILYQPCLQCARVVRDNAYSHGNTTRRISFQVTNVMPTRSQFCSMKRKEAPAESPSKVLADGTFGVAKASAAATNKNLFHG